MCSSSPLAERVRAGARLPLALNFDADSFTDADYSQQSNVVNRRLRPEALTRAMAQELAPKIRVNAIALGSFATEGLQRNLDLLPGSLEKMMEATPLHCLGDVDDLGRLCVYLASRDWYATNTIFHVDGGIESNNSPLPIPDY